MNLQALDMFLRIAKKNTYASETAKKTAAQRPGSKDYEYAAGDLVYHDTYFGGTGFIGEEIVYESGRPVWGMNYNGYVLDASLTEADIDVSLRGALKQEPVGIIPVRGPKSYKVADMAYTNKVTGDLSRFEGREEITKAGKLIYYAVFHGGLII